jgi:ABC-type branched-subunit amino acid transport system substrate-binding protein
MGVAALAGEYHSVVARAVAAKAEALGLPFLCSSAVLDALTEQPAKWVARLAPAQSHSWRIYADFLLKAGHSRIAVAAQQSVYWASGTHVLRDYLAPFGGSVFELDMHSLAPTAVCDELVDNRATALLLLVGYPDPAVSIVRSVRQDQRLAQVMIGAPAGQPEFSEWATLLGEDGAAIPFLRYMPERLSSLGMRVQTVLHERLAEAPSFVAFEGYDTIAVLADVLRSHGVDRTRTAESWPPVAVDGTRGQIQFSRSQASVFGSGLGRRSKSLTEIRRNRIAFGSSTPARSARSSNCERKDISLTDACWAESRSTCNLCRPGGRAEPAAAGAFGP